MVHAIYFSLTGVNKTEPIPTPVAHPE